jgi:prepilin-type processing-associated H-X9-DG protein
MREAADFVPRPIVAMPAVAHPFELQLRRSHGISHMILAIRGSISAGAGHCIQPFQPTTDNERVFVKLKAERIKNITDGTSKTLLLGESTNRHDDRRTAWAYSWGNYVLSQGWTGVDGEDLPQTFSGDYLPCYSSAGGEPPSSHHQEQCQAGWFSGHTNGMNVQMCDGSGTFVTFDIESRVLAYMASIAAAELDTDPAPRL